MKKRLLALVCALALALTMMPVSAAEDVIYIMAINDTVPEIQKSTMPFWSGGYLYVSCTAFQDFGIDYNSSAAKQTLLLYRSRGGGALIFDLKNGMCRDSQGNIYIESAVTRNGHMFVPVGRVAEYFGLIYTYNKIQYGYLVRLRDNSSVLSDQVFLDAASERLAYRYNQYQQSLLPQSSGQSTDTGSGTETEEPLEEGAGQNLYLSLLVQDTDRAASLLDALGSSHYMTFYFPVELLESAGDLTRRMSVTGQAIGLAVDGSRGAESALEELRRGNELLSRATGGKTRLVWLENSTEQTVQALEQAGYCPLVPLVNFARRGVTSSSAASDLLSSAAAQRRANVTVWLGSDVNQTGLRALLSAARAEEDQLLPMTEALS